MCIWLLGRQYTFIIGTISQELSDFQQLAFTFPSCEMGTFSAKHAEKYDSKVTSGMPYTSLRFFLGKEISRACCAGNRSCSKF